MVGTANLPDTRAGLAALDEHRQASMADEGGVSAAVMESEDPECLPTLFRNTEAAAIPAAVRRVGVAFALGLTAGIALAVWTYRRG